MLTWINTVQIVQVGSKSQTLDGTLDIRLDVGGRIRASTPFPKGHYAAFRRNYWSRVSLNDQKSPAI